VAVLLTEVFDVAAGGLEEPQPQNPEHRDEREAASVGRGPRGSEQCLELQMTQSTGLKVGSACGDSWWFLLSAHDVIFVLGEARCYSLSG
jgi:hypothetical protein